MEALSYILYSIPSSPELLLVAKFWVPELNTKTLLVPPPPFLCFMYLRSRETQREHTHLNLLVHSLNAALKVGREVEVRSTEARNSI